jgi:hypothetical protein
MYPFDKELQQKIIDIFKDDPYSLKPEISTKYVNFVNSFSDEFVIKSNLKYLEEACILENTGNSNVRFTHSFIQRQFDCDHSGENNHKPFEAPASDVSSPNKD